ncbi:septum formation protein Maf [Candidatus Peribacteria bacterium]|nr:septum formation protein Maf [Candidatus Peribacteria bacterium]
MSRLILASASPQRKTLLSGLGLRFEIIPSRIEEDDHPEADPRIRAQNLARLKALDVHALHRDATVIGCDTLVVASDGTLLEKPKDDADARRMLMLQSGKTSLVHSAVCVVDASGNTHEGLSTSSVTFKKLSTKEIDWWIESGLWKDRSGGFQIDGLGQLMIQSITGDWTGIVGLPVFLLGELLEKAGYRIQ